jgi:hypothetical protein
MAPAWHWNGRFPKPVRPHEQPVDGVELRELFLYNLWIKRLFGAMAAKAHKGSTGSMVVFPQRLALPSP